MTDVDQYAGKDNLVLLDDLTTKFWGLVDKSGWMNTGRKRAVFWEGYALGRAAGVFETAPACPAKWADVKKEYLAGYEIGYLIRWAWRLVPVGVIVGVGGTAALTTYGPGALAAIFG